jgi:hypothetical protein
MKKFFTLVVFVIPLYLATAQNVLPGYRGFWDPNKKITVLDILEYYPERLPYLRNEVYARYGRPFVNKEYQDYFNRQSWYRIRSDYTDDWLSEADKYNAELIRTIEQAPAAAETLDILLQNIEYRSEDHFLTFNAREVMEKSPGDSYDMYSGWGGIASSSPYFIVGDWVLTTGYSYQGRIEVYAYRLNHRTRRITATAHDSVGVRILEPLEQAMDKLRSRFR